MDENNNYLDTVDSRSVDIIETIINQEEYDIPPQSRLEEVLLELKEAIEEGGGGSGNIYRTTTALTDGATTNPITVDGESVTVESGDFAIYNTQEFIFDGTQWNLLGDRVGLGDLAYMDVTDLGDLATMDTSDLGPLAMDDKDDVHKEISDVDYAALTTAQKNDGTEYFVYETGDDNRSVICKDAQGNFKYKVFIYGVVSNGTPGWDKTATDADAPTTPPTKSDPVLYTSLMLGYTTSEKTTYFSVWAGRVLTAYGKTTNKDASDCYYVLTDNPNSPYKLVTLDGEFGGNVAETLTTDIVTLGTKPTGNRYIKQYDKSYGEGGFTRTVLYDSGGYDTYAPFQTDVPLLDNLSNYDFIVVSIGTDDDNTRVGKYGCDSAVYDVKLLMRNDYNAHYAGYYQRWFGIRFTDTTFNIMNSEAPYEGSSFKPCVYFIIGYKFG